MNYKKDLIITVSNLMTVRNYFHTGLANSLSNSYNLTFLFEEEIYTELNSLGKLSGCENYKILSVKTSKNRLFKYFLVFTLAYNATLYKSSSSKKMIVDQILNQRSAVLTRFLANSKLDVFFFSSLSFVC